MTPCPTRVTRWISALAFAVPGVGLAQAIDIPLTNWTVPPYTSAATGIRTMDETPPRAFIGLSVCRLLDTRPPANNPLDGDGVYATDQTRTYDVDGLCGLPAGAEAVSLNVTVTNTVSNPFGHLKIWPANQAEPNVSTLNWASGGLTVSNAAIVALSLTGTFSVKTGNAGADVIIDVNGYFSDTLVTVGNQFFVQNNSATQAAIVGTNRSTLPGAAGVIGSLDPGTGATAAGYLGWNSGAGLYGVYALGDIGATGMKFFVEPHPTDASKVIRFVALEGPEAGTYFRGTGRTVGGWATIEVPESFRIVTDGEGLTVQLTPVGELVQLAIIHKGLSLITVRSSQDVVFDYEVKGIRRSFRHHEAIADGSEFVPTSPDERLPGYLTEEAKRRLITNGTYREDGSVNLTTAVRLGWPAIWERPTLRIPAEDP